MPRTAIEEALMPRIEAIAAALAGVPDDKLWRFKGTGRTMRVAYFGDGGASIDYRPTDDKKALCKVRLVRPREGWVSSRRVTDIPTGPEKLVDKLTHPRRELRWRVVDIPVEYDKRLTRLRTREHAFAVGFKESITQTFGVEAQAGGEATGGSVTVSASTALGLESSQDTTDTTGEQEGEDAGAGINPTVPPGYDITFGLDRFSVPMKTNLKADTDVDFGFRVRETLVWRMAGQSWGASQVLPAARPVRFVLGGIRAGGEGRGPARLAARAILPREPGEGEDTPRDRGSAQSPVRPHGRRVRRHHAARRAADGAPRAEIREPAARHRRSARRVAKRPI